MSNYRANSPAQSITVSDVFDDPVAYLASLGIDSELVEVRVLPIAA